MRGFDRFKKFVLLMAIAVAMPGSFSAAQVTAAPATAADWQTAAGGKMEFDVASVKPGDPDGKATMNVPLGPGGLYSANGGIFSARNQLLIRYILFAYKLDPNQQEMVAKQLPDWVSTAKFDIEARAESQSPTKDQMRLMMQSLLAERFKMTVHHESRQVPSFGLVLAKPGKLGPRLKQHTDDGTCPTIVTGPTLFTPPPATIKVPDGLPDTCTPMVRKFVPPDVMRDSARDIPIGQLATSLILAGNLDRPVFDQTGLSGSFDFILEFTPEFTGTLPPGVTLPEPTQPPFLEALTEQLGLKLVPQKSQVDVLVVDHIEHPSAN